MSITTIFLFLILFTCFAGTFFRPIWGVVGYLCIYFLYNPYSWWCKPLNQILVRPSLAASFFLIFGALLHNDKLNWNISRKEKEIYLFLAVMWFVSYFFGFDMHAGTFKILEKMTKVFICIFFICRIVNTIEQYNVVVTTFIIGAAFLAYQAHVSGDFSTGRIDNIGGTDFGEANAFATFMIVGASMLGYKIIRLRVIMMIPATLIIAMMLNAFVLARSRGVLIGIVLAIPFILINIPKKYRFKIYIFLFLGSILFFNLMDEGFFERMGTIKTDSQTSLMQLDDAYTQNISRLDFWVTSISIFKDHPFGIGVKNFETVVSLYDPRNHGLDAHNTYVLCYTELGIIGIGLFLLILLETIFELYRTKKMAKLISTDNYIEINVLDISTVLIIYTLGSMLTHSYLYIEIIWLLIMLPTYLERSTITAVSLSSNDEFTR